MIKEVNSLGSQIAEINKRIKEVENNKSLKHMNELRDKRDELEFHLRELLGGMFLKAVSRLARSPIKTQRILMRAITLISGMGSISLMALFSIL